MNKIEEIRNKIKEAKNIVFFGGAGVSTKSGIKDFRSKDGLYNIMSKYGVPYEVMLSHSFFTKNVELFYDFYKSTMVTSSAKPNAAHYALVEYEKKHHNLTIITQNIDSLHEMCGSKNVIELHGSISRNYCIDCHEFYGIDEIMRQNGVPHCLKCNGIIKPDVVLYEEALNEEDMYNAYIACLNADVMIVGGTSLNVYPAANYVKNYNGDCLIIINKEKTPFDEKANYVLYGNICDILPKILDE